MGTAGFVPKNFPDSSPDDWNHFLEQGAAMHGGVYGVHVDPGEKKNDKDILEQAQLAFELAKGVEPYIAFSISFEEGPFTPVQLNLRWILNSPEVTTVIPSMNSQAELEENLAAITKEGEIDEKILDRYLDAAQGRKSRETLRKMQSNSAVDISHYAKKALTQ